MKTKTKTKPKAKCIGADSNVYNILGICSNALIEAGMQDDSDEMCSKVFNSKNYYEALAIMKQYVQFVKI